MGRAIPSAPNTTDDDMSGASRPVLDIFLRACASSKYEAPNRANAVRARHRLSISAKNAFQNLNRSPTKPFMQANNDEIFGFDLLLPAESPGGALVELFLQAKSSGGALVELFLRAKNDDIFGFDLLLARERPGGALVEFFLQAENEEIFGFPLFLKLRDLADSLVEGGFHLIGGDGRRLNLLQLFLDFG